MIPKEDAQVVNSFIKYFSKYLAYLEKEMANDSYSFNEIRIILELLENDQMHAKDIESELDLDKGYTSRILKRLLDDEIIQRQQSGDDKRLYYLSFTKSGKRLALQLNKKYQAIIAADYEKISDFDRIAFHDALAVIQKNYAHLLGGEDEDSSE